MDILIKFSFLRVLSIKNFFILYIHTIYKYNTTNVSKIWKKNQSRFDYKFLHQKIILLENDYGHPWKEALFLLYRWYRCHWCHTLNHFKPVGVAAWWRLLYNFMDCFIIFSFLPLSLTLPHSNCSNLKIIIQCYNVMYYLEILWPQCKK